MSSFHSLDFKGRLAAMGDAAEAAFLEVSDMSVVRFGLDRPPLNMAMIPAFIRHTPDYLASKCLVECVGMGRDGVLKLKVDKYQALLQWDTYHPVQLFVWDSHKKRHWIGDIQDTFRWDYELGQFHDGPEYYAYPASEIWPEDATAAA